MSKLYVVDPHELPRYTFPEVARYLQMPETTLVNWVAGRSYDVAAGPRKWDPLIHRPDPGDSRLSFSNLIEAYVLLALRKIYGVKVRTIRTALEYGREALGIDRVLLSKELRVTTGNVFLQHLDSLINLGRGGQGAMPEILSAYLKRIEWERSCVPSRLFPITRIDHVDSPRIITLDPRIAFGRPIVDSKSIKTSIIAERFKAGESMAELAEDYELSPGEIEEAIRYETAPFVAAA